MSQSRLPDFSQCRTKHVFENYWYCLSSQLGSCNYAFDVCDDYFCGHPKCSDFESSKDARMHYRRSPGRTRS